MAYEKQPLSRGHHPRAPSIHQQTEGNFAQWGKDRWHSVETQLMESIIHV